MSARKGKGSIRDRESGVSKGKPEISSNVSRTSLAWLASVAVTVGKKKLDDGAREMLAEAIAEAIVDCGLDQDVIWDAVRDATLGNGGDL